MGWLLSCCEALQIMLCYVMLYHYLQQVCMVICQYIHAHPGMGRLPSCCAALYYVHVIDNKFGWRFVNINTKKKIHAPDNGLASVVL
mmetsp:Transcript_28702/g.75506  ORF Transcript_28702/g.75506 Transcript_28702/m.75506 type:complete len:87 (-) Transcript_28702:144-404(-)